MQNQPLIGLLKYTVLQLLKTPVQGFILVSKDADLKLQIN